jgi:hypothetical protein
MIRHFSWVIVEKLTFFFKMSGYELSRFVQISQSEIEEYTCSICHDILRNPIVTNCCLQTFCELCINEWLETNNTCPYDRKQLDKSQLSRPPRFVNNILIMNNKNQIFPQNKKNSMNYFNNYQETYYYFWFNSFFKCIKLFLQNFD